MEFFLSYLIVKFLDKKAQHKIPKGKHRRRYL